MSSATVNTNISILSVYLYTMGCNEIGVVACLLTFSRFA